MEFCHIFFTLFSLLLRLDNFFFFYISGYWFVIQFTTSDVEPIHWAVPPTVFSSSRISIWFFIIISFISLLILSISLLRFLNLLHLCLYCLNAEFQRIARRDKKVFLSEICKEIEENNEIRKTRDLFEKIIDTHRMFHAKMGTIKDRNSMDLTEAEDTKKRW